MLVPRCFASMAAESVGARFFSGSHGCERQKPFVTSSVFIRKGRKDGYTSHMSEQEKVEAVRAVYGPRNPLAPRWVSPLREAELKANEQRVRVYKGYTQLQKIKRSKEKPGQLADTVLVEEFLRTWKSGWEQRFADRQAWLAEEKKRLWALHETNKEERFAFKQRQRKLRVDHWLGIKMERKMLKAEIARRNQIERRKIEQTLSDARTEMLQALNEESDNWLRHPDEAVNRRYLTYSYQRWYNFKN